MTTVYRIKPYPTFGNAYQCNRDETWEVLEDKTFETLEEAKEYIRDVSIKSPYMSILPLLHNLKENLKRQVLDDILFNNDRYLTHRRYFIGKPNIKKLTKALTLEGVSVLSAIQ